MIAQLAALALVVGCGRSNFDPDARDALADTSSAFVNNIAFVTSTTHLPLSYGADLAGADAVCNTRAAAAGLPGTYVALMSTATVDARERLGAARGWVRVDGKPFLDRVADLTGAVLHPLSIDELGGNIGSASVHTASTGTGVEDSSNCVDLTDVEGVIQVGSTAGTTNEWLSTGSKSCDETARLYCFGVDKSAPLQFTPATGRHVFVSVQEYSVDFTGIGKADALCTSEASVAGLTGTYVALLATTTASAISRLNLAGPAWVRPDGIPIVASPLDIGVKLLTTPNVTATKAYVVGGVLTGSMTPTSAATDNNQTCSNWTAPASTAVHGTVERTDLFFSAGSGGCSGRVYCFEQ